MVDSNIFINQMLAPAVLISGIGLILLGMNNRFLTITGRIRALNSELREIPYAKLDEAIKSIRIASLKGQIESMLDRSRIQKTAIFLLYLAMTFTILTVFALAADLANFDIVVDDYPVVFSISSLIFIFCSVALEGYEMTMALRTVREDYSNSIMLMEKTESAIKTE